jgi:D-beta-D-heptose 7-phosphate kinase / D-beta-D-heptose 1-phosphate adenosyltransferase
MKIKIPSFEKAKVLVVGDIMLDQYWHGNVSRISPEAPVPVVCVEKVEERIGGAGNVALNIKALGGSAKLLGLVGDDAAAKTVENILEKKGIGHRLLPVTDIPTITKLRIIGHDQQLIRLDFEKRFIDWQEEPFFNAYSTELADCNMVILSDYNKGTLSHSAKLISLAKKMGKPVLVDPKGRDFSIYRGATLITPNWSEFEAVVGPCSDEKDIEIKACELMARYDLEAVLITRGANGMSLVCGEKKSYHLPAEVREVYDVTGAGDTVIATLGCSLASGEELIDATRLANIAAGEVVKKFGTSSISPSELRRAVGSRGVFDNVLDENELLQRVQDAREHGEKIVMTNGCFDILHLGHVTYLEKAKALGHRLIVAVNDDASVSRLKGAERPVNALKARMQVLAALGAVDWVVPFSEDTPDRIIELISPDILVKGDDYQVHEIAGSSHVLNSGGEVIRIPLEKGYSTTGVLKKIATK